MVLGLGGGLGTSIKSKQEPNGLIVERVVKAIKEADGGPYWICCRHKIWIICNQDGTQLEEYRDPEQCEDCCEAMNNEFIAKRIIEAIRDEIKLMKSFWSAPNAK